MEVAGANRRWRCQFRYRGSRRESAVAQLFLVRRHYTPITKEYYEFFEAHLQS